MKDFIKRLWNGVHIDGTYATDLALKFFLLDLLFRPIGAWYIRPVLMGCAGLGLLSSRTRHTPLLYIGIGLLTAYRIYDKWPLADNHAYLLVYFPLAIVLALFSSNPGAIIARQSRWMIAAVFGFAVIWKVLLTPEFIDGTFFRVTFQSDPRFEGFMLSIAGITPEQLKLNRAYLMNPLPQGAIPIGASSYVEPAGLTLIINLFIWATLLLEGAIFAIFVMPPRKGVERARHLSLLLFCVGTYAIAPVPGFGWILLSMGATQVPEKSKLRYLYVACFLLLLFYRENSWRDLAWSLIG